VTDAELPRIATAADADVLADLLHSFNTEFETPTPARAVLADRLRRHLAGAWPASALAALLIGEPALGIALLSFRPSVWYDGPVAMLDELYVRPEARRRGLGGALLHAMVELVTQRGGGAVEINVDSGDRDARRFYEAHGFANTDPGRADQLLLYYREL
jgi:GNAT superfamily N-acetyltransferase